MRRRLRRAHLAVQPRRGELRWHRRRKRGDRTGIARPVPKRAFLATSAENLPFKEDEFDTVVSFETLEHLNDPTRALAEFRRVLRSDGILIGSVPTATLKRSAQLNTVGIDSTYTLSLRNRSERCLRDFFLLWSCS